MYNESMPELEADYEMMARQALEAYGLKRAELTFLQHGENITFRLDARNSQYLLRIHPGAAQDIDVIDSELRWLEALRRAGLDVQTPIKSKTKQFVTQLEFNNQFFYCTILKWLDGEDYLREYETEETAKQAGEILGRLHQHSRKWKQPKRFRRPVRDMDYFLHCMVDLEVGVSQGLLDWYDYRETTNALETLEAHLQRFHPNRNTFGLVHGDLHRGNFVYQEGKLAPIDFSLCAMGWYIYDLAITLGSTREFFRPWLVEQYQKFMPLPPDWESLVEGFYIANMIETSLMMLRRPEMQEILVRRFPIIAREYASKFNFNEHFWF